MKRIHKIEIKNFKTFQQKQKFEINSKNMLVYGANGAGKSSLFWALYTFLQSSIKTDEDVQKYFKYFVESDKSTHQSLRNVYLVEDENSYIELTSIDKTSKKKDVYKISFKDINTNNADDTLIQELNLASDFINYKVLANFYKVTHKNAINLWPVFEHDIFPFLTEGTIVWLDKIKDLTKDVPRTPSGKVVSQKRREYFENSLNTLNEEITNLLEEIERNANDFLKKHFFNNKDKIFIHLDFTKKFKFSNVRNHLWDNEYQRHNELNIKLWIEIVDDNNDKKKIERPHSFLHESMLTRIAIAIRIGALRTRPLKEAKFQILVLDDLLISLDMSNRMEVVRMILNKEHKPELSFFDKFQKIILTHDKGLFNLIRRHTDKEEWVYYNFTKDERDNSAPKIKEDLTPLQKAVKRFEEDEFENCGNELRKESERILTEFLDPEMKLINKDFESLGERLEKAFNKLSSQRLQKFKQIFLTKIDIEKLKKIKINYAEDVDLTKDEKTTLDILKTRIFDFLIDFNEKKNRKELLINETKEILDRLMNSASHHTDNPLYSSELKEAIEKIKNLKDILQKD